MPEVTLLQPPKKNNILSGEKSEVMMQQQVEERVPKVSIIVTCYNLEKYIRECLESLLNQDCTFAYEVLAIDDCSTDGSLAVIRSIQSARLKIIENKVNKGAAVSVTEALEQCRGEYLCRFDGDDKWPADFLTKTAAVLDAHPQVDMVYGDAAFIDADGQVTSSSNNINRRDPNNPILENEFVDILNEYYINAPTIMFRKAAFAKAFPLPGYLIEKRNFIDWHISAIVLHTGKAYYIHEPIAFYRLHAANNHVAIIYDLNAEHVTRYVLNYFVPSNEQISYWRKRKIFADNYFILAERYFGVHMFSDAKRTYKMIAKYYPPYFLKKEFLKHFLGSYLGTGGYNAFKKLLGRKPPLPNAHTAH